MFNIKLEEQSYKMSFKALPVRIQQSKHQQGGTMVPPPADRVNNKKQILREIKSFHNLGEIKSVLRAFL